MMKSILEQNPDLIGNSLIADGFDLAVIGVDTRDGRFVYSVSKCIEILINGGMGYEEAIEYFDYNVAGAYVGEMTPIFVLDHFEL